MKRFGRVVGGMIVDVSDANSAEACERRYNATGFIEVPEGTQSGDAFPAITDEQPQEAVEEPEPALQTETLEEPVKQPEAGTETVIEEKTETLEEPALTSEEDAA